MRYAMDLGNPSKAPDLDMPPGICEMSGTMNVLENIGLLVSFKLFHWYFLELP